MSMTSKVIPCYVQLADVKTSAKEHLKLTDLQRAFIEISTIALNFVFILYKNNSGSGHDIESSNAINVQENILCMQRIYYYSSALNTVGNIRVVI